MTDPYFSKRYQRQILLPGIGTEGQKLLQEAKVLVVGAGGLGCPALQYLVAAGIGTIGIVDGDTVDISNLHRQILYNVHDIDKLKAIVAKEKLEKLNPYCQIICYPQFLDKTNGWEIINTYDIVLDGSDNFATRYLVNDICVLQHKPLIYGAIYRFEGQVAVFNYSQKNNVFSAQYRDLFPDPPKPDEVQDCETAGVIGVLPGIIGCMQASEVIKLITQNGTPLVNRLFTYNMMTNQTTEIELEPTEEGLNAVPAGKEALENFDYGFNADCYRPIDAGIISIDSESFEILRNKNNIVIIDVREKDEEPLITLFDHAQIPLSEIMTGSGFITTGKDIVFFCQAGIRSKTAAAYLKEKFHLQQNIYNLEDGIIDWMMKFGKA